MATRFYLPSTGAPAISPSIDSTWTQSGALIRREMVTTKISSAFTNKTDSESVGTTVRAILVQYISSQRFQSFSFTTSHTWKFQMRGSEDDSKMDCVHHIVAKVISNDGSTVRGTIINALSDGSEYSKTSYTNRSMSGNISNNVSMQDGDRILIEIGWEATNTKTDPYTGGVEIGDNSASDLPEDDVSTNQYNPWFEVSPDLTEYTTVKDLAGTISASGTVSNAIMNRKRTLAGTVSATGSVATAEIGRIRPFGGNISAVGTVEQSELTRIREISGTISALSAVTGSIDVAVLKLLEGVISAAGTIVGSMDRIRGLEGLIAAQGSVNQADLNVLRNLAGTISGASSVSGSMDRIRGLAGTISALSTLSGDISIGGEVLLEGAILASASIQTAELTAIRGLSGSIAASSILAGDLSILGQVLLEGTISAQAVVSGAIDILRDLSGEISTAASVEAAVNVIRGISGVISASGTVEGDLIRQRLLLGSIAANAALTGDISLVTAVKLLEGIITATSTVSGSMTRVVNLSGEISATSTITGFMGEFFGFIFDIMPRKRIFDAAFRDRILDIMPRKRIFDLHKKGSKK